MTSRTAALCSARVWRTHIVHVCLVAPLTYLVWTVDGLHVGLQPAEGRGCVIDMAAGGD